MASTKDDVHPQVFRDEVNEKPAPGAPSELATELAKTIEFDQHQTDMYPGAVRQLENQGSPAEVKALHHVEHLQPAPQHPKGSEADVHPAILKEVENHGDKSEVERLHRLEKEPVV